MGKLNTVHSKPPTIIVKGSETEIGKVYRRLGSQKEAPTIYMRIRHPDYSAVILYDVVEGLIGNTYPIDQDADFVEVNAILYCEI